MPNRRKPHGVEILTLVAILLQLIAVLFAIYHGEREIKSLDVRDAAIERIVEHVETEVTTPASTAK